MGTKLHDISDWCKRGIEVEDYPYIGEIDADLTLGEVVKVGTEYYAPGVLNLGNKSAGVRKIDINSEPEEKEYESELTCPYCGYKDSNSFELDDSGEHECRRCGATIEFERVVTVEYNVYPKSPPEIVSANWKRGELLHKIKRR